MAIEPIGGSGSNSGTGRSTSTSNFQVPAPTAGQVGNVSFFYLIKSNQTTPTTPTGFTLRHTINVSTTFSLYVWSRVYVPGDEATILNTSWGTQTSYVANLVTLTGVDSTIFDATTTVATKTTQSRVLDFPAITTVTPDAYIFRIAGVCDALTEIIISAPTDRAYFFLGSTSTRRTNAGTTNVAAAYLGDTIASPGVVPQTPTFPNTGSANTSVNTINAAITMALKPVVGAQLADVSSPITATGTADIVKGRTVSNSTIATAVLTGAAALATLVSTNTPVTANLTASASVGSVASAFSTDVTASFNSDANHNQAVSTDTIITTAVTADALIANTVSVNSTNIVASFDSDANHNQAIGSDSAITITVTTDAVTGFKAVTSTPITSTLTANSVVTRYADVDVPVTATLTSNATVTSNNIILGEVEVVTTAALNADAQHYQNVQSSRDVTASLSANTRVTSLVQASNTPVIATFAADAQHYQGVQGTQEVTANLNASARVASSVSAVNTSAIVALTADAQHIQYVDPSTEITAGLTADAQHYQGIETSVGITAGLTGSASRTSNMLVSTSIVADIAADVRNQTNLEVSLGVTAGLTADASIGYTFQAVTELEADLFADVSQGFPVTSDTTNVTATVSGNILKGRVASTLTNVTTTLTADALKVTTGQTETSVTVGLPATVTKNILTGSSLGVTANFSTNSRRSNPLTDRDIDVTVALSHGIWIASLDDQPWVIVEGVSIIEATLDPAVETYASLDIDSNYYTLAPNLWEVTL